VIKRLRRLRPDDTLGSAKKNACGLRSRVLRNMRYDDTLFSRPGWSKRETRRSR
jgi:hypothetical protein